MEALIDKGYNTSVLEVLNDVRVYMKVTVLSDISQDGRHMAKWALAGQQNRSSQWSWPPRRVPTQQNLKVWRDCLRGTFMQGINGLLEQVTTITPNCTGYTAYPLFNFSHMKGGTSLMATIRQYPPELLSLIGDINISDLAGQSLMRHIVKGQARAGSDGSVKDGIGGHAFCISDTSFTQAIWGNALTVGSRREMTSLRAEHGGALGILLLLHAIAIF